MRALETGRPSTLPIEPKRRRRAPWIIGSAIVLLFGLGIAFTAYIANHMPFGHGSRGAIRPCVDHKAEARIDPDSSRAFDVIILEQSCREVGDHLEWAFSLRNDGPFSVTIMDLGTRALSENLAPIETRWFDMTGYDGPRDFAVFENLPVALPPGEVRMFYFRSRIVKPCSQGSLTGWSPTLRYRVLGFERSEDLLWPVQVNFTCI